MSVTINFSKNTSAPWQSNANMLKSTREKIQRQEERDGKIAFFETQKQNLKNQKADTIEEIAKKLEKFHTYEDEIAAAKQEYNSSQMFHILDEAEERGEQKCDAVQRNRGFSRTGSSLNNHHLGSFVADDLVLLLLDGRYDFSQYRLLVLCQVFSQELVIGNHLGIVIIQKLSVFNFIGTLHLQVDFYALQCIMPAVRRRITALSQPVFIVGIRHRPPSRTYSGPAGPRWRPPGPAPRRPCR